MISVLIVEDEPLIAEAHAAYLGTAGGAFRWRRSRTPPAMRCARPSEAAASETPIDLVLLDIGLPDASGIALASGLSGLRPAPDIIAITSERDLEMVRAAVGHGALAYLLKPFTFAAFRDRLERYQRYREALPAGTDAASQAEVDRALAELRVGADRSVAPKGAAPGTNDEIARAVRDSADGITADEVAKQVGVSRVTAWRYLERLADEGTRHATDRLRQGGSPEDPLPVALTSLREQSAKVPDTPQFWNPMRLLALEQSPLPDQLRAPFGDGVHGGQRVVGRQRRHDRRIHHPQTVDTVHPKLTVDHGFRGLTDRARSHRVVVRRRGRANEAAKRLLVVHRRTRRQFLGAPCLERGRAPDRTGDPESSDHRCHVAIVAEIVRVDDRRQRGVTPGEPDATAAAGLQRADTDQVGVRHVEPDDSRGVDQQDLQVRCDGIGRGAQHAHHLAVVVPGRRDRPG